MFRKTLAIISSVFLFAVAANLSGCSTTEYTPSKYTGKHSKAFAQINDLPSDYPTKYLPDGNVWRDFASDMRIPIDKSNRRVQAQIRWWVNNQSYLNRTLIRGAQYFYYIYNQTKVRNLPAELALLPVFESGYVPVNRSHAGAVGLWQFLAGTARGFGIRMDRGFDGRHDVVVSTNAALKYLTYLYYYFDRDWLLAIAAYNTGPGNLQAAILRNKRQGYGSSFWSLHVHRETLEYVPKLLALAEILRNPGKYGVEVVPINNGSYFEPVKLREQISMSKAAKMSGASEWTMRMLNAGYVRGVTDYDGLAILQVPKSKVEVFKARLQGKIIPIPAAAPDAAPVAPPPAAVSSVAEKPAAKQVLPATSSTSAKPTPTAAAKLAVAAAVEAEVLSNNADEYSVGNESVDEGSDEAKPGAGTAAKSGRNIKHVVARGETLFSIAKKYHTTAAVLRRINGLRSNSVRQRQALLIPAKLVNVRATTSAPAVAVTVAALPSRVVRAQATPQMAQNSLDSVDDNSDVINASNVGAATEPSSSYGTVPYRVARGDTVVGIAKKFKVTAQQVRSINGLRSNSVKVGRVIRIPHRRAVAAAVSAGNSPPSSSSKTAPSATAAKKSKRSNVGVSGSKVKRAVTTTATAHKKSPLTRSSSRPTKAKVSGATTSRRSSDNGSGASDGAKAQIW